jgi:hypothetical protein
MYHALIVSCEDSPPIPKEWVEFIEKNFHRYSEVEKLGEK